MEKFQLSDAPQAVQAWIKANNDHDVLAILDCYGDNISMFPTFQNFAFGADERLKYFEELAKRKDLKVEVQEISGTGDNANAIVNGKYRFSYLETEGNSSGVKEVTRTVEADFTMAVKDGKIVHHHSSASDAAVHLIEMDEIREDKTECGPHLTVDFGSCVYKGVAYRYTIGASDGVQLFKHCSKMPRPDENVNMPVPTQRNAATGWPSIFGGTAYTLEAFQALRND